MKRFASGLFFGIVGVFAAALCHASYDIVPLTQNDNDDGDPEWGNAVGYDLNDDGTWVWQGFDGADWEIFLSTGKTQNPGPMTNNAENDRKPDINADGSVVWERGTAPSKADIILSNGSGETNISNSVDVDDSDPRIGDGGHVVWEGDDGTDVEIYLYDGSTTVNLSNDPFNEDNGPRVNAGGKVVWMKKFSSLPTDIICFDGATVTNLSNTFDKADVDPQINDSGMVVWSGYDGTDYEIYFWDGLTPVSITQVTDNDVNDSRPNINNAGEVAWQASDGTDLEIYFWDGQFPPADHILQVTDNTADDTDPCLNQGGELVWRAWVSTAWQIFQWDGQTPTASHITQITTDTNWGKSPPKINDNPRRIQNDILWKGKEAFMGYDLEIYAAIACTDEDGDFYCSDAEPGGDDCDDDPSDDPSGCGTCTCGAPECAGCARCINPGMPEVCDGIDNDCSDGIDEAPDASASCDDELYCNGQEACVAGSCEPGTPVDCTDPVACTEDSCNEDTDACVNLPNDTLCGDGVWCNGAEICDALAGCQAGVARDCDDGVGCTSDACNEDTDSCDHLPNDALCDDALWCTGIETCDPVLDCQSATPVDCDDGVSCTVDSCIEASQTCEHAATDSLCDDTLWCNGVETCDPTLDCQAGTAVDCSDGNGCTDDLCNEASDLCENVCNAVGDQDPCCSDPACEGEAICGPPCVDNDGDGFGDPGSPQCTYPYRDCDDGNPDVNPLASEIPGNDVDENCDGQACFIATAAFGTNLEGKIDALRSFRDARLMKSSAGRSFVQAYYRHSPPVASAIADRPWLRALVRVLLLPLVGLSSLLV